ncbi:MAG: hypothetical protein JW884_05975 [Deltaproteobacteria bacterium]|nr:hypothetical protein [Deltaproteobacteria bacterium]
MISRETDQVIQKAFQAKLDRTLREKEIEIIQYWKERLDRLIAAKPEGISALKLEMQRLSDMMENRVKVVKKGCV